MNPIQPEDQPSTCDLFNPSAATGVTLRAALNRGLADSLEYLFGVCRQYFDIPESKVDVLTSRLRNSSRETPHLYALHFTLIEALQAVRLDEAAEIVQRIVGSDEATSSVVFARLCSAELPWNVGDVARCFANEQDSMFEYVEPDRRLADQTLARLRRSLELVSRFAPDVAAEFRELVTTVIVARGVAAKAGTQSDVEFGSVTALRAFGAILFNADCSVPELDLATALIHEQAHTVLFALSPNEGVVRNPDSERYTSPLRPDPRPLEGIFHQVFVLARMVHGMQLALDSKVLSAMQQTAANEFISANVPRYFDGQAVVRQHALLTGEGEFALQSADDFMAAYG